MSNSPPRGPKLAATRSTARTTSFRERAVSSAFWASVESWGQQFVQLLVFIILARMLGPEAYGVVGIALIVVSIGVLLVDRGGWAAALIQEPDLDLQYLDTLFWWLCALSVIMFAGVWIAAGAVAAWFAMPEVARILSWLALAMPLKALGTVQAALLRRKLDYRSLAARSLAGVALGGIAGVTAAFMGAGAWSLVINQVGQVTVETLVLWIASAWRPGRRISLVRLRRILAVAWGLLGAQALEVADDLLARTLVARAVGVLAVGHYIVARRLLMLSEQLLITPLSRVALPVLSQIGRHEGNLVEPLRLGMQIMALVAFPGYVGLALVVPDLLPLVFGRKWAEATAAVQIALLIGPTLPMARMCASLLIALGHTRAYAALSACSTSLLLLFLLVPDELTVEAVMLAFVARTWLTLPLLVAVAQRKTRIDVVACLKHLLPLALATLVMAAAVAAVRWTATGDVSTGVRLLLSILTGGGSYFVGVGLAARPLLERSRQLVRAHIGHDPSASSADCT